MAGKPRAKMVAIDGVRLSPISTVVQSSMFEQLNLQYLLNCCLHEQYSGLLSRQSGDLSFSFPL